MKYSFVIPTFNRLPLLKKCISSVLNQDYISKHYEIIIVNDGSNDETLSYLNKEVKKHRNLKFVSQDNKGPAAARNLGLSISKGKIIVSIDDDCTVENNHLKKLDFLFQDEKVAAVSGAIINPTNSYIAWSHYILNLSSWIPFGRKRVVESFATGNAAFRKLDYIKFQSRLKFSGYSDTLLSMKIVKKGGKILFDPSLVVKHCFWDYKPSFAKYFAIQRRAGEGFIKGGYKFHGDIGIILMKYKFLNLFSPRLLMVFLRSAKKGLFIRFLLCLPLIFAGEMYRNLIIFMKR